MNVEAFEETIDEMYGKVKRLSCKRQECNRKLIEIISYMVENYPHLRFGQILTILEVYKDNLDLFNEESVYMLERIKKKSDLFKI